MAEDIHCTKSRLRNLLKAIKKENREVLIKFKEECEAQEMADSRVYFFLIRLNKLMADSKGDLTKMDKGEIKNLVSEINKKYKSEWTKHGYKVCIKKFFQWLEGYEWKSKKYPERVEWISTGVRKSKLTDPTILSKEEVLKMFRSAEGLREKALVSFMYESGCRVDELLNMKIGNVEFDDYGAIVKLKSGKVGERKIRVIASVPRLKDWIENHPKPRSDNWVWVNERRNKGERMGYNNLRFMVAKWVKKSGIKKRVVPYNFRHSRYTHLSKKWPTQVLYKYMGQVQGSKSIERYVRLSTEDIDDTVLNFYGIKNNKKNDDIKPLYCSRCKQQNPPELEYCRYCNSPLTEKAIIKVEEKKRLEMDDYVKKVFVEQFKSDPVFREKLVQGRIKELQKSG